MGRVALICKHGIRGISNCKDCQREQHTQRVRRLRERRKQLEDQERALEKKWNRENVKIYLNDKATGVTDLKNPSVDTSQIKTKHMAKHNEALKPLEDLTERVPRPCGICVRREDCDIYRRYATVPCKNFRPIRGFERR